MIDSLIDSYDELTKMTAKRPSFLADRDAAQEELKTAAGYKQTIARSKLRDAEATLVAHDEAVAAFTAQIEAAAANKLWIVRHYAAYRTQCAKIDAAAISAEERLKEALEEAKKNAWKRAKPVKGSGTEPASVQRVRAEIVAISNDRVAHDEKNEDIIGLVRNLRAWEVEDRERQEWYVGGPTPAFVQRQDVAERAAFLADAEALPFPNRKAVAAALKRRTETETETETETWVDFSVAQHTAAQMALISYRCNDSHDPEEYVPSPPKSSGKPTWTARFIASRKAMKN